MSLGFPVHECLNTLRKCPNATRMPSLYVPSILFRPTFALFPYEIHPPCCLLCLFSNWECVRYPNLSDVRPYFTLHCQCKMSQKNAAAGYLGISSLWSQTNGSTLDRAKMVSKLLVIGLVKLVRPYQYSLADDYINHLNSNWLTNIFQLWFG